MFNRNRCSCKQGGGGGGGGGLVSKSNHGIGGAGGSGIVVVRYKIGSLSTSQKQLVVLLVSMVVRQFIPLQVLVTFATTLVEEI